MCEGTYVHVCVHEYYCNYACITYHPEDHLVYHVSCVCVCTCVCACVCVCGSLVKQFGTCGVYKIVSLLEVRQNTISCDKITNISP